MWLNDFAYFIKIQAVTVLVCLPLNEEKSKKKLIRQWFNIYKNKIVEIVVQETCWLVFLSKNNIQRFNEGSKYKALSKKNLVF